MFADSMHRLIQIPRWLRDRQQALVAVAVMLAILAASLGMPVFIQPQQDASRPYPCMHHRCGCLSADDCWRGCCCMTQAQKLAWAKDHGVTPPDYALAQADKKENDNSTGSAACRACCRQGESETRAEQPPASGVGLVLTDDFRRCNGLASLWLTMGHALPPRVEACIQRYQPAPVAWVAQTSQSAESLALSPATPPPRHS